MRVNRIIRGKMSNNVVRVYNIRMSSWVIGYMCKSLISIPVVNSSHNFYNLSIFEISEN